MKRWSLPIFVLCAMLASLRGADLKEARVTAVIKDVKLLPGRAEPKPAAVNDTVTQDTAVRTGVDSRSELTFADLTIARLGANTIFSFDKGTRTVELGSGAILLRVPKDSGGAKINTAAVTAAITGTTMMAEYHSNDYFKFIMLEGASQVCQPRVQHVVPTAQTRREDNGAPQDCVDLGPGQMLVGKPGLELGKPVDVDIKKLVKTSQLTNGFGTLGSEDLIGQVILAQLDEKSNGTFVDALDSRFEDQTSHDVIDQKTAASETSTPTPSPSGTPTKFGTPPVITSSNLTTIDRGTVITTDPSITRNAETDYGKIYRGPADDGPASAYLFGSTSSFDTASGFDHELQNEGDVPIAVFKFITLTLAGNPSISTANGGALNLGLISVGDMTSAMPGGRLDFPGINKLLLATQNGSIILGPELSFGDLEGMLIYARGAGSALTLGSSFDVGELNLEAEGSIQVNGSVSTNKFHSFSGVDFLGGSGHVTTGRIEITALNNINFNASQFSLGDFENIDVTLNATNVLNIDPTGEDQSVFTQAANFDASGKTINLFADDPFTISFNPAATLTRFTAGTGGIHGPEVGFAATDLQLFSAGDIYIYGTHILPNSEGGIAGTIMAAGLFHAQSDVNTGDLTAGTSIYVGGNLFGNNFTAGTTIDVVGSLSGFGTAMAGGDITADKTAIPTIISPNGILHVGEGGIHPFVESLNNPPQDGADLQHVITVSSIISPAGIDFSGNQFGGISNHSNGGRLTINADTLRFDAENGIGPVSFDGADAHHFSSTSPSDGGDGGIFEVNTSGDIFVGELISASTGLHDPVSTIAFSGAGGRVSLDAAHGMVTVNSTIIVSSNDLPTGGGLHPRHLSASGGEINIHSGLTSGTAITLGAGSALLSLLNDAAPGPGGTITVLSEGGDIFAQGAIEADRGTILISNFGTPGRPLLLPNGVPSVPVVKIDGGSLTAEFGDILSRGDVQIATSAPVDLNVVTLTISAGNDITDNSIVSLSRVKNSSGNVNISAGANIDIDTLVDFERTNDGLTSDGLNLTAHAGQELLVGKTFRLLVDNSGMSLGSGANILLTAGDQIAVGNLNASVSNRDGHITNGGNITVFSAGLTTHSISAQRFNGGGGYTGTGGNIVFGISGDMNVSGDALFSISNSEDAEVPGGEFASAVGITLTAGNVSAGNFSAEIQNLFGKIGLGDTPGGASISAQFTGMFQTTGDADFVILNQHGLIGAHSAIDFKAQSMNIGGSLDAFVDNRHGSIGQPAFGTNEAFGGEDWSVSVNAPGGIVVTDRLNVFGAVTSNAEIRAGTIASTNVMSTVDIAAGAGGIQRFQYFDGTPVDVLHVLNAPIVTSSGGIDFDGVAGNQFDTGGAPGGQLEIDAASLSFDSSEADIVGPVTFNGGAGGGFDQNENQLGGGDGGFFAVNTTGNITVNSAIEATTGLQPQNFAPSGNGGTVNLNSTAGTITINNRIEVSSNDAPNPTPSPPPRRRSARGGNISVKSGKAGASLTNRAVAININSSAQLLSLLAAAPTPRPGGKVTILATGANSDVNINGAKIQADGGTIDIRHNGDGGHINISGANFGGRGTNGFFSGTSQLSADVIKAGAFGTNGSLSIGNSNLNADTLIRLYATGSNGELIFVANTTLSSGTRIDLAAATITINPRVVVTITGNAGQANIYTNNPNYSGPGGNNPNNGSFGGNGAKAPQSLSSAPPFDSAPSRPGGSGAGGRSGPTTR